MPATATISAVPTAAEIQKLAAQWYRKLDVHAPVEEVLPLLAEDDLEMVFPEATLSGTAEFEGWYEKVTHVFFDEVHTLKRVDFENTDEGAVVKVVVRWEASVWNPPAATSGAPQTAGPSSVALRAARSRAACNNRKSPA